MVGKGSEQRAFVVSLLPDLLAKHSRARPCLCLRRAGGAPAFLKGCTQSESSSRMGLARHLGGRGRRH